MFLADNVSQWPASSLIFALPYLAMGVMAYIVGYKEIWYNKGLNKKQNVLLFVMFLLFFGLRWHLMSDTLAYEQEYHSFVSNFEWAYIEQHSWWWDPGFVILAMLCKIITPDFFFFVFINTLIDIILFSLCLKKYNINVTITILSFLAFQGILQEINTMRNIKAILLFVYSLSYIQERNLFKFLLINALGFTFHSSAALFFPMYWLLNRKYSIKLLLTVLTVITFIYLANINVLQDYLMSLAFQDDSRMAEKFMGYLNDSEEQTISLGFIERILTLILCLLVYNKQNKKNSFNLIIINSFFAFYILYAIFCFNFVFRDRIPYLFVYAYWFLYPYLFEYFGKRRNLYKLAFIILFFGKIYLSTRMCSAYYETVMFHETTRAERQRLNDMVK